MTRRREFLVVGLILVADQVTKALVRASFDVNESTTLIPGVLDLTRVHNTGAAFGLLNAVDFPFKTAVLAVVAAAALVGLALYSATLPDTQRLTQFGLALIIGGATGNLVDRLAKGYVLDFVDAYWRGWHFWAFNVADSAITVGVSLMIFDILLTGRHRVPRTL